MRRRDLVALLSGAAMWPLAAHAQGPEKTPRIGVLNSLGRGDAVGQEWDRAFRKRLDELGLVDGRTTAIDYRWGDSNVDRMRALAGELVELKPGILVGMATPAVAALQAQTRIIPIVFAAVSDPVGSGFVASLAKPGGNMTGFVDVEGSLGGKWVELMHQIAPAVSRVGFLFNPQTAPFAEYYLETFRSAAAALKIEPIEAPVHSTAELEAAMNKFGREGSTGIIATPEISTGNYGEVIVSLAKRYRVPTIYPFRLLVAAGGLMFYGVDYPELLRGAASYVERILKGAKPSELPVQLPTEFDLVINLKAAKSLGLTVPHALLVTADEVIE
jgi:putative tryptophan/tyrosine transport system substrate-binding protein